MKTVKTPSTPAQKYTKAHEVQYAQRDLIAALDSYGEIIASHPDAPEAGYSRTQISGIVKQVVPPEELRAAQTVLAMQHLQPKGSAAKAAERT